MLLRAKNHNESLTKADELSLMSFPKELPLFAYCDSDLFYRRLKKNGILIITNDLF